MECKGLVSGVAATGMFGYNLTKVECKVKTRFKAVFVSVRYNLTKVECKGVMRTDLRAISNVII